METSTVQIVVRHLSGARATEIDVVPVGAHRELILGRARSAAIRFDVRRDDAVGRQHARIEQVAGTGGFRLVDLDSRNGTFLNGERLTAPAPLGSGDLVRLGADGPEIEIQIEPRAMTLAPEPGRTR